METMTESTTRTDGMRLKIERRCPRCRFNGYHSSRLEFYRKKSKFRLNPFGVQKQRWQAYCCNCGHGWATPARAEDF